MGQAVGTQKHTSSRGLEEKCVRPLASLATQGCRACRVLGGSRLRASPSLFGRGLPPWMWTHQHQLLQPQHLLVLALVPLSVEEQEEQQVAANNNKLHQQQQQQELQMLPQW